MLTRTEPISDFEIVRSIVTWELSVDAITKIHINDLVVLSCREQIVTRVVLCRLAHRVTGLALSSRLLNFTDLIPLVFCVAPHVGKSDLIFFKHLDEAVRFPTDPTFNVALEVR